MWLIIHSRVIKKKSYPQDADPAASTKRPQQGLARDVQFGLPHRNSPPSEIRIPRPITLESQFRLRAAYVQSASPAECRLVEEVLAGSFLDELPARLIGDKAYDPDRLDRQLEQEYGIELIAPNRRRRRTTQGARQLRRYKKAGRWSGYSPGCTISAWSPAGNIASKTSSGSSILPASNCCSNIYETASRSALPISAMAFTTETRSTGSAVGALYESPPRIAVGCQEGELETCRVEIWERVRR
jgi:hypothetical protein